MIDEVETKNEDSNEPFGFGRLRWILHKGTMGSDIWEIRHVLRRAIQTAEFKAISGKVIRVSVEPSLPNDEAAGAAHLARQGLSQAPVRCELGPPFAH
eukprot:7438390-Pyramimonas_sp.AAC.1